MRLKEKAGNSKESQTLCLPVQNTWDGSFLPTCPQLAWWVTSMVVPHTREVMADVSEELEQSYRDYFLML